MNSPNGSSRWPPPSWAMLPRSAVVVFMQRLFVRGLVETEKNDPWLMSFSANVR